VLFPQDTQVDGKVTDSTGETLLQANDFASINYKTGYDLDLIGGYDLGMFRLEGELGYKHAGLDSLQLSTSTMSALSDAGIDLASSEVPLDGKTRVLSGMINGLVDFGGPSFGAYAGAGIGLASVKFSGDGVSATDSKLAWQLLAGLYTPISENLDVGLKYRYFHTGNLKFSDSLASDGIVYTGQLSGHFSSHSLLASIVYNFGAPAAPPPPPPAVAPPPQPPAVQTCPDGSTMPVTSACPTPPPPPAPAPAPVEHGERGE
jgi:opacity protein-like surface antigen